MPEQTCPRLELFLLNKLNILNSNQFNKQLPTSLALFQLFCMLIMSVCLFSLVEFCCFLRCASLVRQWNMKAGQMHFSSPSSSSLASWGENTGRRLCVMCMYAQASCRIVFCARIDHQQDNIKFLCSSCYYIILGHRLTECETHNDPFVYHVASTL